ncbi:Phenylalanine ammonia-lyase [Aspergillus sclerotialis]|uniref:Phenylalanine ammonia-lyase n=1 Tax=Aspergillus sclerotialis TaxID=2070753 RepID=A0A3A2ZJ09_9EURO|nr:Phenylalanine ammonia-lyase [Aspergillus sclerotialis]
MEPLSFTHQMHVDWTSLQEYIRLDKSVCIDGESLTIPQVIAVSLYGIKPTLTSNPNVHEQVQKSVDILNHTIETGQTVYGVNTGFGGSADTRTTRVADLQIALKQHLQAGILIPSDKGQCLPNTNNNDVLGVRERAATGSLLRSHALPVSIVRGTMLIRCNSLLRGHSGVRMDVIRAIMTLLEKNMTPVVPARGSISASGDLCPLSYIAGVLEGNPDIYVRIDKPNTDDNPIYLPADKALEIANIARIAFQAKEGLGITNGTSTSGAAACIALHQAAQLTLQIQLLTATGTEALLGRAENYHPFISSTRPHPGQAEAASNIFSLLKGSSLAPANPKPGKTTGLAQDRYALRTAPQWLGPYLEDLALAYKQITIELNSTTDNPLINPSTSEINHGGNFQAMALTSSLEKILLALQSMGKLIYAQCSELLNYNLTHGGLPPNLSADDPSLSFTFKGLDVNMAAYMAELAYLAHPISAHVQGAEMDNQLVNSLALVAGRYVIEAGEVVALMVATYVYAVCQAVDLRSLYMEFVGVVEEDVKGLIRDVFQDFIGTELGAAQEAEFSDQAWEIVLEKWTNLAHLDLQDRGSISVADATGPILHLLSSRSSSSAKRGSKGGGGDLLLAVEEFQSRAATVLSTIYNTTREKFFKSPATPKYISSASRILYEFVRTELGIPMHRGLVDHPAFRENGELNGKKIIGSYVSDIYMAVRDGRLNGRVMEAWKQEMLGERSWVKATAEYS